MTNLLNNTPNNVPNNNEAVAEKFPTVFALKIVGYLGHDNKLFDRTCSKCGGMYSSKITQICPKCGQALVYILTAKGKAMAISEGTIYPILSRLKREGLVQTTIRESTEGPPRKYYELTEAGGEMLAKMNEYWKDIKTGTDEIKGNQ